MTSRHETPQTSGRFRFVIPGDRAKRGRPEISYAPQYAPYEIPDSGFAGSGMTECEGMTQYKVQQNDRT